MNILDTRRITGPSLFTDKSGAMLDVEVPDIRQEEVLQVWGKCVSYVLHLVGWGKEEMKTRRFSGESACIFPLPLMLFIPPAQ